MIALVDYGAGNHASVRKALLAAGGDVLIARSSDDLHSATGIVVPGVGHFSATGALDASWRAALGRCIAAGTPLLGICLGMQWLFDRSEEAPDVPGFGYFAGTVFRLPGVDECGARLKVPHVGWNRIREHAAAAGSRSDAGATALDGDRPANLDGRYVYFTHAYAAPVTDACVAVSTHGCCFAAAVARGPVWGMQFHPEKSGTAGLELLRAFVRRTRGRST